MNGHMILKLGGNTAPILRFRSHKAERSKASHAVITVLSIGIRHYGSQLKTRRWYKVQI